MGWIVLLILVLLALDVWYVGWLREHGHFMVAHKMQRFGEKFLFRGLMLCGAILLVWH